MYIYGKNVAEEALLKGEKIKQAFIYEKFNDKNLLNKISSKNIKINYVTKYDLDRLQSGNHQGIILEVPDYDYAALGEVLEEEIIVMLDHLEDPHNLGAIIRTCEAAGSRRQERSCGKPESLAANLSAEKTPKEILRAAMDNHFTSAAYAARHSCLVLALCLYA